MSDVCYTPLIDDMTWSYSRISCFDSCPYSFFIKYISMCKTEPKFYASYGSFMHKLIENYYRGNLKKSDMLTEFVTNFSKEVKGDRPSQSIVSNYIKMGISYLNSFERFKYDMIAVEKKVEFDVHGKKFVGFIDYLGKDGDDLVIIDNKSRKLKQRSKRKKPTKNDEEIDEMLRQLYLYAHAIKKEYGKFPTKLCFNCFNNGEFIEEPFKIEKYEEAISWFLENIERIRVADEFYPYIEYFHCKYICDVSGECIFNEMNTR